MRQRVYVDTSVISALYDDRYPDRRTLTAAFWARLAEFEACTSELARIELHQTPDPMRRDSLLKALGQLTIHQVTHDMRALARRYVDAGLFTRRSLNDGLHVAAAVLTRNDVLVSWNFRHLVNRSCRAAITAFHLPNGLPNLDIISPPEI